MTLAVRAATSADAPQLAALHAARISEGFLPTLGSRFLTRLYRRIAKSPRAFAHVAVDDGTIVGFAAGSDDVGRLYREFLLRDGVVAALVAAPRLARSSRRVIETLRYPSSVDTDSLPRAEILSVAVAAAAGRRGIGRRVVAAAVAEFDRRGIDAIKVVAAADNTAAERLYTGEGFTEVHELAVHGGTTSRAYVRRARVEARA